MHDHATDITFCQEENNQGTHTSSPETHREGSCVHSLLHAEGNSAAFPTLPPFVPAGFTRTAMADRREKEGRLGTPLPKGTGHSMKRKEAVLCLCIQRKSVHFSLHGTSFPLS